MNTKSYPQRALQTLDEGSGMNTESYPQRALQAAILAASGITLGRPFLWAPLCSVVAFGKELPPRAYAWRGGEEEGSQNKSAKSWYGRS